MRELRAILKQVNLTLPASPRSVLPKLLALRALLAIRGVRVAARPSNDRKLLTRADVCSSVGAGLAMFDPIRAAHFQTKMLIYACKAGDPYRAALALSLEAGQGASAGGPAAQRTEALFQQA